jgi:cellulose synthase/poly-beta-1,6-N-acetylglucosamine synthase-like glycosyltransferase
MAVTGANADLGTHHSSAQRRDAEGLEPLSRALAAAGQITCDDALKAQALAVRRGVPLADVLFAGFGIGQQSLALTQAEVSGTVQINPQADPPDPRLIRAYGPDRVLAHRLMPWRRVGDSTIVLGMHPRDFRAHRAGLERKLGPVRFGFTTLDQLENATIKLFSHTLAAQAETRVPDVYSCRGWQTARAVRRTCAAAVILAAAAIAAPVVTFMILCAVATALLGLTTALKLLALFAAPSGYQTAHQGTGHKVSTARLPVITLLIPLRDETDIAGDLIARLQSLDYPRSLLDICLVLEEDDSTTRTALGQANLPTWMRPIIVPRGGVQTKPRALNFALPFARGSLIGVYDAEDAPAADQLHVVARHYANCAKDVACLQGVLDYYNADSNWLTRCFTIEYASWFRVVLPGLARLGFVVPLGGTTLFFRRDILEQLHGWDAHNVTEDADLGVRLARQGYRTEFFASVTEEEANGRYWPWVKQRSRWLKGYAITYGVHMRQPRRLWRDLGTLRFLGIQLLLGGTLLQFLLAPILWTFWLLPFGLPHPLAGQVPSWTLWTLGGFFMLSEIVTLTIGIVAVKRADKGWLAKWTPTLQLYFPLAVIATYKGLAELLWKPFYWDKTKHGIFAPAIPPPPRPPHPVSDGSRTPC